MAIKQAYLDELEKRRAAARVGGGEDKLEARRKKGVFTARDRIAELFTNGNFQEWGMHADHDCSHFGLEDKVFLTDGVVTGVGTMDGRTIAAFTAPAASHKQAVGRPKAVLRDRLAFAQMA